jgi:hypothetical protein
MTKLTVANIWEMLEKLVARFAEDLANFARL